MVVFTWTILLILHSDLVTLALNLYTQGVSPNVDYSDINSVIKIVEESTKIPVNERWPYAGALVTSAFSGRFVFLLLMHQIKLTLLQSPRCY